MWCDSYPIVIVTAKDSWFEEYANKLVQNLIDFGLEVELVYSYKDIKQQSIAIYLSYPEIVPPEYISLSYISIVAHASDLPKGKGFSPWVWQILEGKNQIPICLFKMCKEVDAGDVYFREYVSLMGNELVSEIREKLSVSILQMVISFLSCDSLPEGVPQSGEPSIYRKRYPNDSEIDPHLPLEQQFNLLRVVDNERYPAFFKLHDRKYLIKIEVVNE